MTFTTVQSGKPFPSINATQVYQSNEYTEVVPENVPVAQFRLSVLIWESKRLKFSLIEPAHEIITLFVLRKLILQTCMRSHPVGLDVWLFGRTLRLLPYFIVCEQRRLWRNCANAQARLSLRWSTVISAIISWADSFVYLHTLNRNKICCFADWCTEVLFVFSSSLRQKSIYFLDNLAFWFRIVCLIKLKLGQTERKYMY